MRRAVATVTFCIVAIFGMTAALGAAGDIGHLGPSYAGAVSAPSGEKPEHKLWFHAGTWWGHLYSPATGSYQIFRLHPDTATWVDTGVATDPRESTKADVLWDGSHLVIASHAWSSTGSTQSNGTRLYRLQYEVGSHRFLPDAGFPVTLSHYKGETISIDRDSAGRLWATWTASGRVMVAVSNGSDASWGAPFVLPVSHTITSDDISALAGFDGRIGVMWSDQQADLFGFAIHDDGQPPGSGWSSEVAHQSPNGSDDHLNLKVDAAGVVYAAVKTENTASSATLTAVLRRGAAGGWSYHPVSTVAEGHTRPILLLDEASGQAHVFATTPESGGTLVRKTTALSTLAFGGAATTTIVRIGSDLTANNASSTRDSISPATGQVVLGSTANTTVSRRYVFHMQGVPASGGGSTPTPTPTATVSPTTAPTVAPTATPSPGLSVTLEPAADAYVYSGNATRNYGTDISLRIRQGTTASPYTWRTYLSFDLTGIAAPTSATLRLFVTDPGPDAGAVWRVASTYEGSSTRWTELGLTWSNAPLLTGDPVAAAQAGVTGSWLEFDVGDALDGSGRLDLALQSPSSDSVLFSSREGSVAPELVLVSGG